jgi:drug/metabolite transporter (DMT)-like permease
VLAFFLQVRGQAGVSPTVGSILCLLESQFAMLFALLALWHMPGGLELIGAGLIFTAAIGASVGEARG